jgi:DNA-binding response OmpR family regulator
MGKAAPDLVILDSRMPNTDGEHVLHVLRSNPATATIRVLAISGFQEDLDKLRQLGSDAELLKPFGKRALLAKILPLLPGLATKES